MKLIDSFQGEYRFLSNFYPCFQFPSVEHCYQAAKTLDKHEKGRVMRCDTPGKAKRMGREITIRTDWDEVKFGVMLELVRQKFRHRPLAQMLLSTGDAKLVEGNHWHDLYWGVCDCKKCNGAGVNFLGKILMQVREEIVKKSL